MSFHMMTRSRTRRQARNNLAHVILNIGQRLVDAWTNQPNPHMSKIKEMQNLISVKKLLLMIGCEVEPSIFDTNYKSIVRTLHRACINTQVDVSDVPNYDLFVSALRG